jgi:hypothetical protein
MLTRPKYVGGEENKRLTGLAALCVRGCCVLIILCGHQPNKEINKESVKLVSSLSGVILYGRPNWAYDLLRMNDTHIANFVYGDGGSGKRKVGRPSERWGVQ